MQGASQAASVDPLSRALATSNLRRRAHRFKHLGATLAVDLERAFEALATLENGTDREAFIQGMFGVLAEGDPTRALEASKRLADGDDKKTALTLLADHWAGPVEEDKRDAKITTEFGANGTLEDSLGISLLNHWPPRPVYAALWARELTHGDEQMTILGLAAAKQYPTNPSLAESFGREFVGEKQTQFQQQFLRYLSADEPEAAWRWTESLADPTLRHDMQEALLNSAATGLDPAVAARKLAESPPGAFKDQTITEVAQFYGMKRPDDAVAWANSLPEREAALALPAVAPTATLRMGMILGTDAEGYPYISNTAVDPNSPERKALHPDDRILSVGSVDAGFVAVRNLGLLQVADLIKGPAGSVVQLQLASKLAGGGYGAPATVQLTRPPPRP